VLIHEVDLIMGIASLIFGCTGVGFLAGWYYGRISGYKNGMENGRARAVERFAMDRFKKEGKL
jgi:hypothetical protein